MKHNKKRNTAFLYEILVREGTKATLTKDFKRLETVKQILVDFFNQNGVLSEELKLYNSLRIPEVDSTLAEKYLLEVKNRYTRLNKRFLFNEQTKLINTINKKLGMEIYNNFIPYYKDLATISQIFNLSTPIKEKILLEQEVLGKFKLINEEKQLQPIDNIVYNSFVKKFNEKYSNLLSEQKELLTKYINSFADEGLELKIYLNEEISNLNEKINSVIEKENIKNDHYLLDKTKKLFSILSEFKQNKNMSQEMLESLLKIQQFVHEVESND